MRLRLNDNTQEALQFLVLGSGIVLGGRLAYLGALKALERTSNDPLDAAIAAFGQGYLLANERTAVLEGMDPGGRAALAFVLALATGAVLAVLGYAVARMLRRDAIRAAVIGGRTGLLLAGMWGLFAALALPPVSATIGEEGIVLRSRPAFLGELSLPAPAQERIVLWSAITEVGTRSIASRFDGCGSRERVVVLVGTEVVHIAGRLPSGPDCNDALHAARNDAERLATEVRRSLVR